MNYRGIIIEESLDNTSVLNKMRIVETKIEPVTPEHKTPWLQQWTLHTVEIPEEKSEEITQDLSKSFDKEHISWYADYKNDKHHYVIYPGRVFKVDLRNPVLYNDARAYGISLGIPEYQIINL